MEGFGWAGRKPFRGCRWAALAPRAPRKGGAHRRKRERRPPLGMMLHQDGSRDARLEGRPPLDLIVTLHDATGEIHSAFLGEEEGTASTFRALTLGVQTFKRGWGHADPTEGARSLPFAQTTTRRMFRRLSTIIVSTSCAEARQRTTAPLRARCA